MQIKHTLEPIYNENSKVLILGSIPSVKSREEGFYYAHPRNKFWKVLGQLYEEDIDNDKEVKIKFLKRHYIALFDVLQSCDINASSDSSIKNPVVNDFSPILNKAKIKAIFTTGQKAYSLYQKYCYPQTKIKAILLPSTSPANCSKGIEEKLIFEYQKIKYFTDEE